MWNWDASTLNYFTSYLDSLLQNVAIPNDALFDVSHDRSYLADIDEFYSDICDCLVKACGSASESSSYWI